MTDDDPNEAYEVVPIEPGPHGPPKGWWTVKTKRPSGETFSRQGKGSTVCDRSGISSKPCHKEGVGEGEGEMSEFALTTWHRLAHDRAEATTMQGEPSEQVYRFRFHFGPVGKRSASYAACT
jgi:hypothetical protein